MSLLDLILNPNLSTPSLLDTAETGADSLRIVGRETETAGQLSSLGAQALISHSVRTGVANAPGIEDLCRPPGAGQARISVRAGADPSGARAWLEAALNRRSVEPTPIDVSRVGLALAQNLGGGDNAVLLTVMVRRDDMSPSDHRYQDGMKQIRAVAGRDLTSTELRDLDHFLTSYAYTQGEGVADRTSDDEPARRRRVIGAEIRAVGIGAATVGYSAVKSVSQSTGVDFVKYLSSGNESAFGRNTSQASVREAWEGLRGTFYGVRDAR